MIYRSLPVVLLLLLSSFASTENALPVEVHSIPDWVDMQPTTRPNTVPVEQLSNGLYYLMVDHQLMVKHAVSNQEFNHYSYSLESEAGLENGAQIYLDYDPAYQQLQLHQLDVVRKGQRVSRIESADIQLIQRETDLDRLIYNGEKTLSIVLDDMRVGDIVDYSYSIIGENPVYDDHFMASFRLNWDVPVAEVNIAVNWQKPGELFWSFSGESEALDQSATPKGKRYGIQLKNVEPYIGDGEEPSWFLPYRRLHFSEFSSWADVVNWGLPLYNSALQAHPDIDALAKKIQSSHKQKYRQLAAALAFVQSDIRYLGIEMGENSHKPSLAVDTLSRRYGDCKDKVVLLNALLAALDIDAYPALVHTRLKGSIQRLQPTANAFNHVISYVQVNNKVYWLDPTRQYQLGSPSDIFQKNYKQALVLKVGNTALTPINTDNSFSLKRVEESFDLRLANEEPASYSINTVFQGLYAENEWSYQQGDSTAAIEKNYLNYYREFYPGIAGAKPPASHVDEQKAQVKTDEHYQIADFWQVGDSGSKLYGYFYGNAISAVLRKPETINRHSPFALSYPQNIVQDIEILLPNAGWSFDSENVVEDNAHFTFTYNVTFDADENKLRLLFHFLTKADAVSVEDIAEYIQAIDRVNDLTEYSIYYDPLAEPFGENENRNYLFFGGGIIVVVLLLVLIADYLRAHLRRKARPYRYAVVSPWQFLMFSMSTIGVYQVYWFFRAWQFIKKRNGSELWPVARAFFMAFWFFPLYKNVGGLLGAEHKWSNRIGIFSLLAVVFFCATWLSNRSEQYGFAAVLVATLACLPLLVVVNHAAAEGETSENELPSHSLTWGVRHVALLMLGVPIISYLLAQQLFLVASNTVISGDRLWGHDLKFMRRNGVVMPGEEIRKFYSDAFWDIRSDGNGFTGSGVFSYWLDEDEQLWVENAPYSTVTAVDFHSPESILDSGSVNITTEGGESFMLYVAGDGDAPRGFYEELKDTWLHSRKAYELGLLCPKDDSCRNRKKIEELIGKAVDNQNEFAQVALADLYSRGDEVKHSTERALYWYRLAHDQQHEEATWKLAWHLVVGVQDKLRDADHALVLAQALFAANASAENYRLLAAVHAERGEFEQSIQLQRQAIGSLTQNAHATNEDEHQKEKLAQAENELGVYKLSKPLRLLW